MKQFFKTVWALVKKDFKDVVRNPGVMIMTILPVLFTIIFQISMPKFDGINMILYMTCTMTFAIMPISFLATIVSEEKEKHTLRTLILSGVSAAEFMVSKILVTWFLMQLINTINFFATKEPLGQYPKFFLITTLASICLFLVGATVGLICKDQMTTGAVASPLMLVIMIPGMLSITSQTLAKIANFSPIDQALKMYFGGSLNMGLTGQPMDNNNLLSLLVIFVWTVVMVFVYKVVYKKMKMV